MYGNDNFMLHLYKEVLKLHTLILLYMQLTLGAQKVLHISDVAYEEGRGWRNATLVLYTNSTKLQLSNSTNALFYVK